MAPADVASCFSSYRPDRWSPGRALCNLEAKLLDRDFVADLQPLLEEWPAGYSIEAGAATVRELIAAIEMTR